MGVADIAREDIQGFLKDKGVQTGIHYPIALPKLKAYAYLRQAEDPMFANGADGELLSLPMGEHLAERDQETVIEAVKSFYR